MPTLPTLTVTDAQMNRLIAVWPGATVAEKAANYQHWLASQLVTMVVTREIAAFDKQQADAREAQLALIKSDLPNLTPPT